MRAIDLPQTPAAGITVLAAGSNPLHGHSWGVKPAIPARFLIALFA